MSANDLAETQKHKVSSTTNMTCTVFRVGCFQAALFDAEVCVCPFVMLVRAVYCVCLGFPPMWCMCRVCAFVCVTICSCHLVLAR